MFSPNGFYPIFWILKQFVFPTVAHFWVQIWFKLISSAPLGKIYIWKTLAKCNNSLPNTVNTILNRSWSIGNASSILSLTAILVVSKKRRRL